ncbi:alpha/beta fold hydrolase [Streptomyces sp. TLI_171]|uniref:alpha/beta fold hydrolase n=1 Tax=Streptomyces sp. TLI_171 TaxID=1938859 RepID=UPI000C3BFDBD|nr:alpha/beta hydrolase [Streptomyces sp. TLI_171]RKE22836.1 pimeloyl-ACP methyl ester carboxylesterase [Streptomyces sp. TLI_171]
MNITVDPQQPDLRRPFPPLSGTRHRHLDLPGVRLHVAEAGRSDGEPVVLLHGFPQHWYAWRRVVPLLADRYRLICPDLRGFGWSQAPARGYDTATRVADVLALLDELGLAQVQLIGHEWGAWAGFHACLRAPERFGAFLALNIVHPWPLHRRLAPQAWRFWYTTPLEFPLLGRRLLRRRPEFTTYLLRRGTVAPAARSTTETAETAGAAQTVESVEAADTADAFAEFAAASAQPGSARAGELLHRAFALRDVPALAVNRFHRQRLSTPTELLGGEKDFILPPEVLAGGERHADDLRTVIVAGAGHYLHEERPELVAAAARRLFARVQLNSSTPAGSCAWPGAAGT